MLKNINSNKLSEIQLMIEKVVEFEDSACAIKNSVKPGIDTHLDDLKRFFSGIEDLLTRIVGSVRDDLPVVLRRAVESCLFVPQVGFLLAINETSKMQGSFENENEWKMIFRTNGYVMYKNRHMRELDDRFGDIHSEINGM